MAEEPKKPKATLIKHRKPPMAEPAPTARKSPRKRRSSSQEEGSGSQEDRRAADRGLRPGGQRGSAGAQGSPGWTSARTASSRPERDRVSEPRASAAQPAPRPTTAPPGADCRPATGVLTASRRICHCGPGGCPAEATAGLGAPPMIMPSLAVSPLRLASGGLLPGWLSLQGHRQARVHIFKAKKRPTTPRTASRSTRKRSSARRRSSTRRSTRCRARSPSWR
jgi:hypothetical protein